MLNATLQKLLNNSKRRVAGIMSGTSLDGVDVALTKLSGSGSMLSITLEATHFLPYPKPLKEILLKNSVTDASSVLDISQLNALLPHYYAQAVTETLQKENLSFADLDLVGCHGQTIHHIPIPQDCASQNVHSTLQIGDISTLATLLETPVVGNFRTADMALGGQGAPLVPYLDYVFFTHPTETRGLLNLGGIANMTILPPMATPEQVIAFDTGPANMLIDALTQKLYHKPYDAHGAIARTGTIHDAMLSYLMSDAYLHQTPPKSTGRERYNPNYIENLLNSFPTVTPADVLATVTTFTAQSVYQAYEKFIQPEHSLEVLIVSGGGMHNSYLMEQFQKAFTPIPIRYATDYGMDADAKEALCFAVLAHEFINGVPTNLPSVTGASAPTLLGNLGLPFS